VIGLVGVTGLAGVGKTTAAEYLSNFTGGRYFYLGQTVLNEVGARGLLQTRENERQVRIELRREKGRAAFAIPYVDKVAECLRNEIPVFIDAIFVPEEFGLLRASVPNSPARLLAIDASLVTRQARLAHRSERPFTTDELLKRDRTELQELGTGAVIAAAEYKISNEQTFEEFYSKLADFVSRCG
jgi:dephospho-CoA kinase